MARRTNDHPLLLVARAPWPVGVVLGLVAFFGIHDVLGPTLARSPDIFRATLGRSIEDGALSWVAWAILAAFWIAALVSHMGRRYRRRLLQMQTGLDSLRAMRWPDFERLVGEAFRRQGYSIEETGLGGADGGIDLVLHRHAETTLVQCKQWRQRNVNVRVVREMFGLLAHHGAQRVVIVSLSDYTADARRFAEGKPIELIHGESLLALVREGQNLADVRSAGTASADHSNRPPAATRVPAEVNEPLSCPRCGTAMIKRSNRNTGDVFWGCTKFPACRGTRAIT